MWGNTVNTSNKLHVSRDSRGLRCSEESDIHSPFWVNYFFLILTPSVFNTVMCVSPAGLSARWVNDWWTGDVGGHWGWRHGGLGQGAQTHTQMCIVMTLTTTEAYLMGSVWCHNLLWPPGVQISPPMTQWMHFTVCVCVFVFSRLAIRQARWATSQRNTYSSRPPTVCWACSSLWLRSMLDRTPRQIPPSQSCTPTASTETQTVSTLKTRQVVNYSLK